MINIEFEVVQFGQSLARFWEATHAGFMSTVVELAMDLLARIQMRTPVDTGRARNSWHLIRPGTTTDSFVYTDGKGKGYDGGLGQVGMTGVQAGVGTNVVYMINLEAGHSRQAPGGMVAISVQELRGALDAKVAEVLKARWSETS